MFMHVTRIATRADAVFLFYVLVFEIFVLLAPYVCFIFLVKFR